MPGLPELSFSVLKTRPCPSEGWGCWTRTGGGCGSWVWPSSYGSSSHYQLGATQVQVVGVTTGCGLGSDCWSGNWVQFRLWECQLGVVRGVSTGCGPGSGSCQLGSGCGSVNWVWSGECQLGVAQVQVSTRFRLWECQLGVVRGVSTGCGPGSGSGSVN